MNKIINTKEESNEIEILIEMVQKHKFFIQFTKERYAQDSGRLLLLQEILSRIEGEEKEEEKQEELIWQIYLYGSMVKSQDLIARQMFLWLLDMAENGLNYKTEKPV